MGPVGMEGVLIGSQRLRYEARHPMEEAAVGGVSPAPTSGRK